MRCTFLGGAVSCSAYATVVCTLLSVHYRLLPVRCCLYRTCALSALSCTLRSYVCFSAYTTGYCLYAAICTVHVRCQLYSVPYARVYAATCTLLYMPSRCPASCCPWRCATVVALTTCACWARLATSDSCSSTPSSRRDDYGFSSSSAGVRTHYYLSPGGATCSARQVPWRLRLFFIVGWGTHSLLSLARGRHLFRSPGGATYPARQMASNRL